MNKWEVSYRNIEGANLPVYRIIENKDDSVLWKLHINSFAKKNEDCNTLSEKKETQIEAKSDDIKVQTSIKENTQLTLF